MPRMVTADSTPEDVVEIAKEYAAILKNTKLSYTEDRVIADFKLRAAQAQSPAMTVPEWEAMWDSRRAAAGAPPAPPAPKEKKPKPIAKQSAEEISKSVRQNSATVDPNYFWMSAENLAIGRTWIALRKNAHIPQNLFVVGPSGCGKTEGLRHLASEAKLPFYKIDCGSITTPDKWVGHKEVNESGTYYVLSEHLRWLSADGFEPGIVVYDEINRLHPSLLNILIPILDGSQSIWVPDLGIYVKVHPDTMIAATANIGTGFAGTYGLDTALHDRFSVTMEQTFPPESEEVQILVRRTGLAEDKAYKLVAIAKQTRIKAENGDLSKPVSTRALLDASHWATTGMTITEAAEATFIKKYSNDGSSNSERMMVRLILQGLVAGK